MKKLASLITIVLMIAILGNTNAFGVPEIDSKINRKSLELNEKGVRALMAREYDLAGDLFLQAVSADKYNLSAAYNLAGVYLIQRKEGAAITLLTDIASRYSDDPDIYIRLGDAYFSNQEPIKTKEAYAKAYSIDPEHPGLASKLGTIYSLLQDLPAAERMFTKAVEESPQDGQALLNLSSVLLANKKVEEAIRAAKKSLQHSVTSEAYLTLGSAYEEMKDLPNALIAFEKAASLGNKDPQLQERITSLRKISSPS
ncbi:MAG: tetratricopeptide repeat protein [Bdellovibrionales bacterium]|nr:tetratricopeptide repeat protein [Bdellovibrionales bacterium]